jgi:hypothetical protein
VSDWLDALRSALDERGQPVDFFLRDDDAGWADRKLTALLEEIATYGVPVDVAIIPEALGPSLATELVAIKENYGAVEFLQHGFAHRNHESDGKKSEFGRARDRAQQRSDIATGRQRLRDLLGPGASPPLFVPPWNRCTADTVSCLASLGFSALSRDAGAEELPLCGLVELPVTVDWSPRKAMASPPWPQLGERLADSVTGCGRIGVMLHHEVMSHDHLRALGSLLSFVGSHPGVRCRLMTEILVGSGHA